MTIPLKIISKKEFLKNNKRPNQEEIWDGIANPWKTYVVKRIPIVEEFLSDKKGKVIDLGCGNGRNMVPNPKIKYYGVDFSSGQLKHAEYRIKIEKINAVLFKQDGSDLSMFRSKFFDYGLFMATLHCIEGKKNREKALLEFYRVLKKNAEALISIWNSEDKRFNGLSGDIYMSWKEDGKSYMRYYYLYQKKEFLNLLKKIGFEVLEIYEPSLHDRFSKKNWIVRVKK